MDMVQKLVSKFCYCTIVLVANRSRPTPMYKFFDLTTIVFGPTMKKAYVSSHFVPKTARKIALS